MPEDSWLSRFTDYEFEEGESPKKVERSEREFEAADEPEVVRVVVDESLAVHDVVVVARWRDSMDPPALGPALLDAANDAIMSRLVDAAEIDRFTPEQEAVTRTNVPDAQGDPTSPVAESLVTEVLDLLSRFDTDLTAYTDQMRQAVNAAVSGNSATGRIVVTMAGSRFSSVDIDADWASFASHTEIGAEALSAFQAAQSQAGTAATASVTPPASIARLQELASDPQALCKQLGLLR